MVRRNFELAMVSWMLGFGRKYFITKFKNLYERTWLCWVEILNLYGIVSVIVCLHDLKYVPPTDKNSSDAEMHDIDLDVNVLNIKTWLF
jgi:hypothetical protein